MSNENALCRDAQIKVPLIAGAMYPCSNPELVAAVSNAGGIGIVQPITLTYVNKFDFREGIRHIRTLTDKPIGLNLIVEKSVKSYEERTQRWLDIALEEGIRFFITALGNPSWVVKKVHAAGGIVYHDVTERKWAEKALAGGVDGLICVNSRAGGHAGTKTPEELWESLSDLGVPLVSAGGVSTPDDYKKVLELGYAGVQMGTRFIATTECTVHADYKNAIVKAVEDDIVLTEKLSGVPVAVINTPTVAKMGLKAGFIGRTLLQGRRTRHWMRTYYVLSSLWRLRSAATKGSAYKDFFQAGKSVEGIDDVPSAEQIVKSFAAVLGDEFI